MSAAKAMLLYGTRKIIPNRLFKRSCPATTLSLNDTLLNLQAALHVIFTFSGLIVLITDDVEPTIVGQVQRNSPPHHQAERLVFFQINFIVTLKRFLRSGFLL